LEQLKTAIDVLDAEVKRLRQRTVARGRVRNVLTQTIGLVPTGAR
jgi:hypothetical protein